MCRHWPIAAVTVLLTLAPACRAEVAVGSSLEWLTCESERVVVGRVEKVVSTPAPKELGDIMYHEITVLVKETIKGKAEERVVFYLRSHRAQDDALPAVWMRSKEPTLLFLSTSRKTDINIDGKLVLTPVDVTHAAFDLAAPGRYAFDARGDILAKKDAILTTCRDTAKKQADHLQLHPNGRVIAKRVSAGDTPAGKVLYAGSAVYLRVPEFKTDDKKADPVRPQPVTREQVAEIVTGLRSREFQKRAGALIDLERLLPKTGPIDDAFLPVIEPLFRLSGWGGIAEEQARIAEDLLVRIGRPARPLLEKRSSANDAHDRRVAVELLVRIGPKDVALADLLRLKLADRDGYVRKAAIEGLASLGNAAAKSLPDLEKVASEDPILLRRVGARRAMIEIDGTKEAQVLALAEFVAMRELPANLDTGSKGEEKQSFEEAAIYAAAVLGELGARARSATGVLEAVRGGHSSPRIRAAATEALREIGRAKPK